jgi:hypothetical protein
MIDKPSPNPAKDERTAFWRLTLILPPSLWCMGFCLSHFLSGCDIPLALSKATAYVLSGMGGWLVYLLIWKPSNPVFTPWKLMGMNVPLLGQTVTSWPFSEMLAHGLIVSISLALLLGPMFRWFDRHLGIKPTPRSSLHPLSDDQVA